jgi:hypothetical protein
MTKILRWKNRSKKHSAFPGIHDASRDKDIAETKESAVVLTDLEKDQENVDESEATFIIKKEELSSEMGTGSSTEKGEDHEGFENDIALHDSSEQESVEDKDTPPLDSISEPTSPMATATPTTSVISQEKELYDEKAYVDDPPAEEEIVSAPSTSRSEERLWREGFPSPISLGYSRIPVQTPDRKDLTLSAFINRSSLDATKVKKKLNFSSSDEASEERFDNVGGSTSHDQILGDASAAIIWLSTRREYQSVAKLSEFLAHFEVREEFFQFPTATGTLLECSAHTLETHLTPFCRFPACKR